MDVLGPITSANDIPTKAYVDSSIATQHTTDNGIYGPLSVTNLYLAANFH